MAKIRSQQLNPNFTGSFNVSGSFGITGPLTATTFVGMLSSSAQIESEISGSTTAVSGGLAGRIAIIEGNVGAQDLNTTATPTFDGLNLTNNTSITGSLTVSNDVSGSSTSTGSFGQLNIKQQKIYEKSDDLVLESTTDHIVFRTGVNDRAALDKNGSFIIGRGANVPATNHSGGNGSLTVYNLSLIHI